MTTVSSYNVGLVTASEVGISLRPKFTPSPTKNGVMYCHAAGSDGSDIINPYAGQSILMQKIAALGYNCFSGQHGGPQTWGNQTALNAMTQSYNHIQTLSGTTPGKIALVGNSMGGLAALNWAKANIAKVSCIVGVIPVINVTDIKVNDRQGYGSIINAAYGGSWLEATYGASYNPATIAASGVYDDTPMLFFYGTTDTLCVPEAIQAFKTTVGDNVTLVPIVGGHEISTYNAVNHQTIVDFITANN